MIRFVLSLFVLLFFGQSVQARTITDAMARTVTIPDAVERVICSGPGCLRLLSYLQGQQLVVAVDDIEAKRNEFDARPYALANPQFKTMPVFGQFRGQDNPELILTLEPQPQIIFKVFGGMGTEERTAGQDRHPGRGGGCRQPGRQASAIPGRPAADGRNYRQKRAGRGADCLF
jgi:ABC-type Fe3+-hydroxamate transport system substrate-binding protein